MSESEKFFLSLIKEGFLFVDENGKVINNKTGREIGYISNNGYKTIAWRNSNKIEHQLVHRLVHIIYNDGFTDEQPTCNHKDGNKENNHFSNLERNSSSENMAHAFSSGLKEVSEFHKTSLKEKFRGEKAKWAKITDGQAKEIRTKYKSGDYTYKLLSEEYKISITGVCNIVNNKIYKLAGVA